MIKNSLPGPDRRLGLTVSDYRQAAGGAAKKIGF
jgi:hypothetical protein